MYWHMRIDDDNLTVERGIALHKLIRLLTASTNGGGYLNFMGNEFGHPEWIDFPREGNNWSYKHARRQWSLVDSIELKYKWLNKFDEKMVGLIKHIKDPEFHWVNVDDDRGTLSFIRDDLLFVYNFSPTESYADFEVPAKSGEYKIVLSSDDPIYGGYNRVDNSLIYKTTKEDLLKIYIPSRVSLVFKIIKK